MKEAQSCLLLFLFPRRFQAADSAERMSYVTQACEDCEVVFLLNDAWRDYLVCSQLTKAPSMQVSIPEQSFRSPAQ